MRQWIARLFANSRNAFRPTDHEVADGLSLRAEPALTGAETIARFRRLADQIRAHHAASLCTGAELSRRLNGPEPCVVIHRRFDPARSLFGPSVNFGNCLAPEVSDGAVCWFDPELAPEPNDVCLLLEPSGDAIVKRLLVGPGGKWLLGSNQTPRWLRGQQIVGPMVVRVNYDGWAVLDPAATARVDAESAEYERQCEAAREKMRQEGNGRYVVDQRHP